MRIADAHVQFGVSLAKDPEVALLSKDESDFTENLRAAGVEQAVILAPNWIGGDTIDPEYAAANDAVAKLVRRREDQLRGLVRVNPNYGQRAKEAVHAALADGWAIGLALAPAWDGFWANDLRLLSPILETVASFHGIIYILGGYFDYPRTRPLVIAVLAKKFPQTPLVLAQISAQSLEDAVVVAGEFPNVYLTTAGISGQVSFRALENLFVSPGAPKLLYASDFPYHMPRIEIDKVRRLPDTSEVQIAQVLWENLLGLLDGHQRKHL